jgi:hypothetical protein
MKLREFFLKALANAKREDPRGGKFIKEDLDKAAKEYRKLRGAWKRSYDKERLSNPYPDSRVLNGTGNEEIKTVLVGIDIDLGELLLADRMREKGTNIDLVVSHHPSGKGLIGLDKVMAIQPGLWRNFGLSDEIANGVMKGRMEEVARGIAPSNHTRVTDAARILGIPFICTHTIADNCVANFLQKLFDKEKPKKLKSVLALLRAIPEYKHAMKYGVGPEIFVGDEKKDAGKIYVDMTGGTSGPDSVMPRLSQSGIKTVVGMHVKESCYKLMKSEYINYVNAGHISSDNLGMNLMLDAIDPKGRLKVVECSGFKRFRRKNG